MDQILNHLFKKNGSVHGSAGETEDAEGAAEG